VLPRFEEGTIGTHKQKLNPYEEQQEDSDKIENNTHFVLGMRYVLIYILRTNIGCQEKVFGLV
jgi:hypothetical protein